MHDFVEFLIKLATGDMTPDERRVAWKLVTTVGYRAVMIFMMVWAYGGFELFGWGRGFARADSVDRKIQSAVQPIFEAQTQQSTLLTQLTALVNNQLANSVATEIRLYTNRRCRESDPQERDRLQAEIDDKKREYKSYRKEDYHYSCGDV